MIIDLEKQPSSGGQCFDVCIAGGGAAGIALTVELAHRGMRVALLEAGGRSFEARSQALYSGESAGLPFGGMYNGRCRVLGGTTTQWGGQILEIDQHVFGERAGIPDGTWPFQKSELEAAYRRALNFEGLDGCIDEDEKVWNLRRLAPPSYGDELVAAFSRWCPSTNFARIHASTLRENPNICLFLHANLCALRFGEDGAMATEARTRTLGGRETRFFARRFVLALGGIETCRFLLQPGTPRAMPWASSKMIGRHFQDHISCSIATVREQQLPAAGYFDYFALRGFKYQPKLKLSPETQRRLGTLDVCGTIAVTREGVDDLAMAYETYRMWQTRQLKTLSAARIGHFLVHVRKLLWQKMPSSFWLPRASGHPVLRLTVQCEQSPASSGDIRLTEERDRLGLYRARANWRSSEHELHSIRTFLQVARTTFLERGYGDVSPDIGIENDESLTAKFNESFHHLGGTRMAAESRNGVVDPNLMIFGTRNVYICSSAVFPSAGFANPTHTVVALALRLADHLCAAGKTVTPSINFAGAIEPAVESSPSATAKMSR